MSFEPKALAEIIEGGGVPFRQNAISFIFSCPKCQKKNKLYIRKRDGRFVCWVCKETDSFQGRAEWALTELYGTKVDDLRLQLYGTGIPDQMGELDLQFDVWGLEDDEDEVSSDPLPKEYLWPPHYVSFDDGEAFYKAAKYLASRGVNIDHVRTYDIRYDPQESRVIFPVKVDGRLVGWQGRYTGKTEIYDEVACKMRRIPKVLTSETLRDTGGHWLMFQDRLKGSPHCVLAEGPISAIKAHLCGGNVASMGKAVTENQLATIARYGIRKIYLALDPDAAAEVDRILETLDADMEVYLLLPPKGRGDLGDATQEEVLEEFKRAPRLKRGTLMFSLGGEFVI